MKAIAPSYLQRRRRLNICAYIYIRTHTHMHIYIGLRVNPIALQAAAGRLVISRLKMAPSGISPIIAFLLLITIPILMLLNWLLALTRSVSMLRPLCTNHASLYCTLPPALLTRLQYDCNTIAQQLNPLRSLVCYATHHSILCIAMSCKG